MKCPNPNCPFQFDPSQVPPGAVIGCPQCGMQFTLGPAPAAPPPAYPPPVAAAPPGYGPPPGYPPQPPGYGPPPGYGAPPGYPPQPPGYGVPPGYPPPGYPGAPAADPAAVMTEMTAEEPEYAAPREPRQPRKASGGGAGGAALAIGGVLVALFVGMGLLAVAFLAKRGMFGGGGATTSGEFRKNDYNFAFAKPAEPWAQDPDTQNVLGVNVFAFKRTDPEAWLALGVRDYETRMPRPSELKERLTEQLNKAFENLPPDLPVEEVTWAGQTAERYSFRAVYKPTGDTCAVECTVLGHKGIAYWYYSWVSETNEPALAEQLAALRDGFRVLDQRTTWSPTAVVEAVHRSKDGRYKFTDFERVWGPPPKGKEPSDEDDKADLIMTGVLKSRDKRDFPPKAELVVMVLGGGGEPLDVGKEYVESRYKKLLPDVKFEPINGPPEGDPPSGPEDNGAPVARMKLVRGGDDSIRSADKLIVVSAVSAGGKTVVAEASCPWRERIVWERRLIQLTSSLKAAK